MKIRGFEVVSDTFRKFPNKQITLPTQGSVYSAGYDFYANENAVIEPNKRKVFMTDVKAYMRENEVLHLYIRSSVGIKKGLVLANSVAVIDKDFYENADNDGNIGICLHNIGDETVTVTEGERIAQGIFGMYLKADAGNSELTRVSGLGSTGKF